ncbi:MAG: DUF86 domain-containing protein [Nitrospirae bacterium]|nr:DUF86 domain-containing protein [Nitrospirota bacterium]
MPHDPEKYVYDALEACETVMQFVKGKKYLDYTADKLLRSGVERQLIIIGEALNRLHRESPGIASEIKDFQKIVNFRNIVVHSYDIVEDETVWGIVEFHIPLLYEILETLLKK